MACNRLGCVSSDSVTLTTAALAPHLVYAPTLQVLGNHHDCDDRGDDSSNKNVNNIKLFELLICQKVTPILIKSKLCAYARI